MNLQEILYARIRQFTPTEECSIMPSMRLVEDLGLNSLTLIALLGSLDNEFHSNIFEHKFEEVSRMTTVADLITLFQ